MIQPSPIFWVMALLTDGWKIQDKDKMVYFFYQRVFRRKRSNEILRERNGSLWWGVWIENLVHVAILTSHWGGVLSNSICIWYALHTGGRVFLQRKSLGLHWDLNTAIFSTTHTHNFAFPIYVCLTKNQLSKRTQPWMIIESWEEPISNLSFWLDLV